MDRLALDRQAPVEAQIAAIADDVAYTNHDLDDGLRAGFIEIDDLTAAPLAGPALAEVDRLHPGLEPQRRVHETMRRLIDCMVRDLIDGARPACSSWHRRARTTYERRHGPVVAFSPSVAAAVEGLREFLHRRVYRHYKVNRMSLKARRVVRELAELLLETPDCLPDGWRERAGPPQSCATASTVRDYIAGMTDRYAMDEHDRLFKLNRERP